MCCCRGPWSAATNITRSSTTRSAGRCRRDLNGKRVGVRAYTQTTGAWVRGFLARDYGIDVERVRWVTFEDAHVAEYQDPPTATRAAAGKEIARGCCSTASSTRRWWATSCRIRA